MQDKDDFPVSRAQELDAIDQVEHPATYDTAPDAWELMQAALEQLRVNHLPFRRVTPDDVRKLEQLRTDIVDRATSDPELFGYYEEAWNGVRAPGALAIMPLRRIVARQIELMESVFFTHQLQRYASAPENAGWIELFRRWGASPSFNQVFDEIDRTLAPDFVSFYLACLRSSMPTAATADRLWEPSRTSEPLVHHPWLRREGVDRGPGAFMDSGIAEAHARDAAFDVRPGAGGEMDAKGLEGADQPYETPSGEMDMSDPPAESDEK